MFHYFKVIAGAHNRNFETGHQRRSVESLEAHVDHNNPRFISSFLIASLNSPLMYQRFTFVPTHKSNFNPTKDF